MRSPVDRAVLLERLAGRRVVAMVSGGKDSVAMWLLLRQLGLEPLALYTDTLWEWKGHAAHLNLLEARIGEIHRLRPEKGFADLIPVRGCFPSRVRRWCTEELKLKPARRWLDSFRDEAGCDVVVAIGVRREESAKRAAMVEWEWSDFYDCEVWRPILGWTVADVAGEHRRAAIPMHPLYHQGAERVGCFPCVNASKSELALVDRLQPERVDEIEAWEAQLGATMFTRDRRAEKRRLIKAGVPVDEAGPSVEPVGIREVMRWATTDRGGRQFQLVRRPTGCARWGVCEAPASGEDSE